jgi:hypothetical protein
MAMPLISAEKREISYNESANYSEKEISDGTFSQIITFNLGL